MLTSCGLSYFTREAVGGMRLILTARRTNKVAGSDSAGWRTVTMETTNSIIYSI